MLRLITLATAIAATGPANAQSLNYDSDTVKANCSAKWGSEYDMVKYCMDQRRDGFATYQMTLAALPDEVREDMTDTLAMCEDKWKQEWDMTSYCMQANFEAASEIPGIISGLPQDIGTEIARDCFRKWNEEITMVTYCMTERADGWHAINN